jgi:hypothetical protein
MRVYTVKFLRYVEGPPVAIENRIAHQVPAGALSPPAGAFVMDRDGISVLGVSPQHLC